MFYRKILLVYNICIQLYHKLTTTINRHFFYRRLFMINCIDESCSSHDACCQNLTSYEEVFIF